MIAALAFLVIGQSPIAKPEVLRRLADKVAQIGESERIDAKVAAFLRLKVESVKWTSAFDSEREVQVHGSGAARVLIFVVPEKPFPEFGKTWLYGLKVDGTSNRGGVSEPRAAFKGLSDAKATAQKTKAEIEHWVKALDLGKR